MVDLTPMVVILSVVDPKYKNGITVDDFSHNAKLLRETIKLADKNGLYYYFVKKLLDIGVKLPEIEINRWKKEEEKLTELKEKIVLLNMISNNYSISYMIIKACYSVPHVPRDIDIFVHNEDRTRMIHALEHYGMKCVHKNVTETSLVNGAIKIDIYADISYIGNEFIDETTMFQSKVNDKIYGITYSSLNYELNILLMIVHSFLGHRSISLLDFLHLNNIMTNTDLSVCKQYADELGWGAFFDLAMNELNYISNEIYMNNKILDFPYFFDTSFIMSGIDKIEGLSLTQTNKVFLRVTLFQEKLINSLNNTPIYNYLKSSKHARIFVNEFTSLMKQMRGDRKQI